MQWFHKFDVVIHELNYEDQEYETYEGRRRFKTIVYDKNTHEKLGFGTGRSKRSSQQRAAKDALIRLNLIGNDIETEEYFDHDGIDIDHEIKKSRLHISN